MGENTEYANGTDLLALMNLDKIRKMAEFPQNWNSTGGQVFSAVYILQGNVVFGFC